MEINHSQSAKEFESYVIKNCCLFLTLTYNVYYLNNKLLMSRKKLYVNLIYLIYFDDFVITTFFSEFESCHVGARANL